MAQEGGQVGHTHVPGVGPGLLLQVGVERLVDRVGLSQVEGDVGQLLIGRACRVQHVGLFAQVAHQEAADRPPRVPRPHAQLGDNHARAARGGVGVGDRLPVGRGDDLQLQPPGRLRVHVEQLILPISRATQTGDGAAAEVGGVQFAQQGDVVGRRRANPIRLLGHGLVVARPRPEELPAAAQVEGHVVVELAVVPGDAGDGGHQLAARGAQAVDDVHLPAHQTAAAILRPRGHQLRPADREGNPLVGPRLRDEVQRRDDAPAGVRDDGEVAGFRRRVAAIHQVMDPVIEEHIRLVRIVGVHGQVELGQRFGIVGRRPTQGQAIAQVLGQTKGLGRVHRYRSPEFTTARPIMQ